MHYAFGTAISSFSNVDEQFKYKRKRNRWRKGAESPSPVASRFDLRTVGCESDLAIESIQHFVVHYFRDFAENQCIGSPSSTRASARPHKGTKPHPQMAKRERAKVHYQGISLLVLFDRDRSMGDLRAAARTRLEKKLRSEVADLPFIVRIDSWDKIVFQCVYSFMVVKLMMMISLVMCSEI